MHCVRCYTQVRFTIDPEDERKFRTPSRNKHRRRKAMWLAALAIRCSHCLHVFCLPCSYRHFGQRARPHWYRRLAPKNTESNRRAKQMQAIMRRIRRNGVKLIPGTLINAKYGRPR